MSNEQPWEDRTQPPITSRIVVDGVNITDIPLGRTAGEDRKNIGGNAFDMNAGGAYN